MLFKFEGGPNHLVNISTQGSFLTIHFIPNTKPKPDNVRMTPSAFFQRALTHTDLCKLFIALLTRHRILTDADGLIIKKTTEDVSKTHSDSESSDSSDSSDEEDSKTVEPFKAPAAPDYLHSNPKLLINKDDCRIIYEFKQPVDRQLVKLFLERIRKTPTSDKYIGKRILSRHRFHKPPQILPIVIPRSQPIDIPPPNSEREEDALFLQKRI